MTEKELLYVEDAVGHEQNIIKIIDESINYLEDEDLCDFLESEKKSHEKTLSELLKELEGKSNE